MIQGAGELPFIGKFGSTLSMGITEINTQNLKKFRTAYLNKIAELAKGKPFVTDKMPQNFWYIDLIFSAIPEAKIIHVRRDPVATCWSNFKHYFSVDGLGYSYDLHDTLSYFKLYKNLMDIWNEFYGDRIYHLNYEKLTLNQTSETKKAINYIGVGWQNRCLEPHKNKRVIRTASQQQVRKKVYVGSSQEWRKFEPYLNGTFDELLFQKKSSKRANSNS